MNKIKQPWQRDDQTILKDRLGKEIDQLKRDRKILGHDYVVLAMRIKQADFKELREIDEEMKKYR